MNVSVKTPTDMESTAKSPVVSAANVTTPGPAHTTPGHANRSVSDPTNQTLNKEPPAEVKELNEQQYLTYVTVQQYLKVYFLELFRYMGRFCGNIICIAFLLAYKVKSNPFSIDFSFND